jgi:hypothetical protein
MATIPMIPVGPVTTLNRSIFLTERECRAQVGTILFAGTVDMSCWRISIPQQSEAILSISAPFVKTTMTFHSPRAMVATGPHGEISLRLPWRGHEDGFGYSAGVTQYQKGRRRSSRCCRHHCAKAGICCAPTSSKRTRPSCGAIICR